MIVKTYSEFSLTTPGCHPGVQIYIAKFRLDTDVSGLFPYINAVGEESKYYKSPHTVQFVLDGVRCALFTDHAEAVPFVEREHAVAFIHRLIAFLNDLDEKKDTIEPDFKEYKPVPVINILKILPKTNCKKCGYATCMAFSAALSKGEVPVNKCPEAADPKSDIAVKLNKVISSV